VSFPRAAGSVATIGGVLGIPAFLFQSFPNEPYWWYCSIGFVLFFALSIFYGPLQRIFIPAAFRRHGIVPNRHRIRVPKKREKVEIGPNYTARISTEKDFFFLEEPRKNDLVDIIEVLSGEKIDESDYAKSRCDIVEVENRKDETVSIYWRPKNEKKLKNKVHKHFSSYVCSGDSAYGPGYFWQGYIVDAGTGLCEWSFHCPEPVELAYAFTLPTGQNRFDLEKLWRLGQVLQRRDCHQPEISHDKMKVKWNIDSPIVGNSYVCIVIYKNGEIIFKNESLVKLKFRLRFILKLLFIDFELR
jgi:hypothetical protein